MLDINKKIVVLDESKINFEGMYQNEELISESMIPYVSVVKRRGENCYLYGFKDSFGNVKVNASYTDVMAFKNRLAWVFNENGVAILIDKNGNELLYLNNLKWNFEEMEKQRKKYLKDNRSFASKNKFNEKLNYKVFIKNNMYGLKNAYDEVIVPALFSKIFYKDGVLLIDNDLVDPKNIKFTYKADFIYNGKMVFSKEFNNNLSMEKYVSNFKEQFLVKINNLQLEVLNKIFSLKKYEEEQTEIIFSDLDKSISKKIKL